MVVYVLGANPPFSVFNGYCHRIWGKKGLDKVLLVGKGLYLVRFNSVEQREQIWNDEPKFFDSKPVIMKRWDPDMELHKETIKTAVPAPPILGNNKPKLNRIRTEWDSSKFGQNGQQQPPQHMLQGPMSDETEGVAKGSCRPLLQTRSSTEQQRPNTTQQQQLIRANNGADAHGQAQSQTAIQTKVSTGNVQGVDIGDIGEFTPDGDTNSKIFFNSLRVRTCRNNINRVQNTHGIWVEDHDSITRGLHRLLHRSTTGL
ncbi:5-methyltetrahydropteroyltriglutamate--homocysteine methyltransferase [Bienertia sinuspersici]